MVRFLTPFNYDKNRFAPVEHTVGESLTQESDYVDIQELFKRYFPNYRPSLGTLSDASLEDIEKADVGLFEHEDVSDLAERDLSEISAFISENADKLATLVKNKSDVKQTPPVVEEKRTIENVEKEAAPEQ